VSEPTTDVSAQRVFEAELHLTGPDYREALWHFSIMSAFRGFAVTVVVSSIALTVLGVESTDTEYLVPWMWLPFLALGIITWFVPDLFAWRLSRTSPFREGATVRLDAEQITYTGQQTSLSYKWPLVRKAIETHSAFHLVAGTGLSAAICILPKRMFPVEDHVAMSGLILSKVGRLRQR
jgi:hypothetical protein